MTEPETSVVEQTLCISARPETVWRYWTDPERMCDWWGTAAELDPRPGGACVVEMGGSGVMRGEYVELVPHERIVFTFGWEPTHGAPDVAPGSSVVEITLTPDGDGTILTLRHTGLPPATAGEHRTGWAHFLPVLANVVSRTDPHGDQDEAGEEAGNVSVDVRTRIHIDRPVDEVAAFAADPCSAPDWYANIRSAHWKTEPLLRAGSVVEFVARFLGRRLEYSYEIVELVPGERLVMRTADGPFPMETTYTWTPTPSGGTHMTLRNRGRPAGFSRLAAPLMVPAIRRANRKDLATLKSILERR